MKNKHRPLNSNEQKLFCKYIHSMLKIAKDSCNPLSDFAKNQISLTMWRWTADGVNIETGVVKKDVYKYDITFHPATQKAIERAKNKEKGLRHEHVVPKKALTNHIIENNLNEDEILALLLKFCRAVIVTKEEDRQLKPRDKMPDGWSWDTGCPYYRYVTSKLINEVQNLPKK